MGLLDPDFNTGLLGAMNNPLTGLAIGLLSGAEPGGTFAGGFQQGLSNMQGMQRAALSGQLAKAQLEEYERAKREDEQRRKAVAAMFGSPGSNPTPYRMSDAEMFPGERQIPGLANAGQPATGLYQVMPEPVANMLQRFAVVDPEGAAKMAMGALTQQPGDVKTVDLGDRVGVIDPATGQIVQTYRKGATPTSGAESGEKLFSRANTLRDEYVSQSKDFVTIKNAYGKIHASAENPSPAGDLSLIFSYMKILDPTSVVREGEQASARNAAGVPDQIRNLYNRVVSGEQLNPEQRADFVNRAGSLFSQNLQSQREMENYYGGLSQRSGIDPQNVLVDVYGRYRNFTLDKPKDNPNPVQAEKTVGGKRYVRINGEWYQQ